jgi:hypothetical protein
VSPLRREAFATQPSERHTERKPRFRWLAWRRGLFAVDSGDLAEGDGVHAGEWPRIGTSLGGVWRRAGGVRRRNCGRLGMGELDAGDDATGDQQSRARQGADQHTAASPLRPQHHRGRRGAERGLDVLGVGPDPGPRRRRSSGSTVGPAKSPGPVPRTRSGHPPSSRFVLAGRWPTTLRLTESACPIVADFLRNSCGYCFVPVTCRKPRSVPRGEREVGRRPRVRTEAST